GRRSPGYLREGRGSHLGARIVNRLAGGFRKLYRDFHRYSFADRWVEHLMCTKSMPRTAWSGRDARGRCRLVGYLIARRTCHLARGVRFRERCGRVAPLVQSSENQKAFAALTAVTRILGVVSS